MKEPCRIKSKARMNYHSHNSEMYNMKMKNNYNKEMIIFFKCPLQTTKNRWTY